MLGITIAIGNSYKRMAARATASFAKNAGLETRILTPQTSLRDKRMTKLDLFDLVPEDTFIFFDADTLMIRQEDLSFGFVDGFGACENMEIGAVTRECIKYKLDRALYFNSGVMFLDRERHAKFFDEARALDISMPRHGDQTHLNIAAQRSGIRIELFADRYNYIWTGQDDIPDDTIIVHGVRCFDPMQGRGPFMALEF